MKRIRETGGDLALESPTASTRKALEITGLTNVFTIHSEPASATTSIGDEETL